MMGLRSGDAATLAGPRGRRAERSARTAGVLLWMVVAIALVAGLAFWDEERESRAALADMGEEQANVAAAAAAAISARIGALSDEDVAQLESPAPPVAHVLGRRLAHLEVPGSVLVLLSFGDATRLFTADGRCVEAPELASSLTAKVRWTRLDRAWAASVGLPQRTAMAGLAPLSAEHSSWGVAVVATAQRERDREVRAEHRLLLGVGVASGLVLAFGGLALRKQRIQLELARELAVAEVTRERDEQLVLADKLATMGALATGIAHEISTPLGVIVGRADQLSSKLASDARSSRAIRDVLDQAERIMRVVRGFLTLARGERAAMEHADPTALARSAVALVEHRFAKSGVALESDVARDLPRIACEPRLFEQALANLLLNACDACAPGGRVQLQVCGDGERVAFVVLDDGAGIAPDIAHRVAEPFFTSRPATSGGAGLGLAIANEIVKHHNGTLTVVPRSAAEPGASGRSRPRGTRACIEVPSVSEVRHV